MGVTKRVTIRQQNQIRLVFKMSFRDVDGLQNRYSPVRIRAGPLQKSLETRESAANQADMQNLSYSA